MAYHKSLKSENIVPTVALSTSGIRVEVDYFLSACHCKLPSVFSIIPQRKKDTTPLKKKLLGKTVASKPLFLYTINKVKINDLLDGDVLVFDGGRIGRVSEPAFHMAVKLWALK